LGCDRYKEHRDYVAFSTNVCHDGNHLNLIYFRDSKLLRCFSECHTTYNLYTLVQKVKDLNFYDAVKYVSNFVGREYQEIDDKVEKISDWEFINKYKKIKQKKFNDTYKILPQDYLDRFIKEPNKQWIEDGISAETQREWDIFYDLKSERICYGIYDREGNLVGIKGRTTKDEEKKYLALVGFEKANFLVGLNKTLPYILQEKKVLVFESYKSVLLAWQYGYKYGISVEGNTISDTQYKELLKLDAEIILALDKDVNKEYIKETVLKIRNKTKLSIISDEWSLIQGKDAPVDRGKEVFEKLFKKRFIIKNKGG
jgi:DNA primase